MKNTILLNKKYKNYNFSEGEDVNDMDLEVINARTSRIEVSDYNYESYWMEPSEFHTVPKWNKYDLQYDAGNTFQIGNNIKGGI